MKRIRNVRFVGGVAAVSAAVFACATPASGALIAEWNFDTGTNTPYAGGATMSGPSSGSGTLSTNFPGGDLAAGTGVTGVALQVQNNANNLTGWIQFAIDTTGLQDLILTFESDKLNNQGFDLNQVSHSIDGGANFLNFGATYDPGIGYSTQTFDFTGVVGIDNNSLVVIRITFAGAGGGQSQANNIDEVQFNAVPEPGTIALLGVAALIGFRRRRRA